MKSTIKRMLIIAAVVVGLGQLTVRNNLVQFTSEKTKENVPATSANLEAINPEMIAVLKNAFSNLDKTVNTGKGFDYWPNGGIQIAYYHLATFVSYKTISNLSPYPVFLSGPHGITNLNLNSSQTFGHYNPQFLQWFQNHLIEMLENEQFVGLTQENFQAYLGNTAKAYWATYTILNQHPKELNTLLEDYEQRLKNSSVPDNYYYNIAWTEHSEKYDSLTKLTASYNTNVIAPAVYFWLRRRIDGTDRQIFSMLENLLSAYQIKPSEGLYYNSEELPLPDN